MKKNKFDELTRDELLKACLELEDENATLRPKPPKFKLGQVLAFGPKNPWPPGQPVMHFAVLSLENKNGEWHYGHSRRTPHEFNSYPEKKLRALTATEMDGTPAPAAAMSLAGLSQDLQAAGATPVAYDIETDSPGYNPEVD